MISCWTPASTSFASARVRPKSAISTRPSGRLISTTSAHRPSPSAPISTSLKTQATHPPSLRERARKYPTAVAPPISRRSHVGQPFLALGKQMHGAEPHPHRQLGALQDGAGDQRRLMAALPALQQLTSTDLTIR